MHSPQPKEGDDRVEAKIDAILLAVETRKGDELLKRIDDEYEGQTPTPALCGSLSADDARADAQRLRLRHSSGGSHRDWMIRGCRRCDRAHQLPQTPKTILCSYES